MSVGAKAASAAPARSSPERTGTALRPLVARSAARIWSALASGWAARISAMVPVTTGAAAEVPVKPL